MEVHSIRLKNYRNIRDAEISFSDGINVIQGMNAQGKTNLLEAVMLMSLGRSFRRSPDSELITRGESCASVSMDFSDTVRRQNIEIVFSGGKTRRVTQNRVPIGRMSQIIGAFRAVMFCPAHLSIVQDGPAARRSFIDVALSSLDRAYMSELQRYSRILSERSALLKQISASPSSGQLSMALDALSFQLAESAANITVRRAEYIEGISRYVKRFFSEMTADSPEVPSLVYISSSLGKKSQDSNPEGSGEPALGICETDVFMIRDCLYEKLMAAREREIFLGTTLYGVHKDDIEIRLDSLPARNFASQGQQRSLALSMKLAEGEMSREATGECPVFLLDDMLSELDSKRRSFILRGIEGRQVLITTCESLPDILSDSCKVIHADAGNFT